MESREQDSMTEPSRPVALTPEDVRRYARNIRGEVDGAALYRSLAAAEANPRLREVYERLAATEDRHRELWEDVLRQAGHEVPTFAPSRRTRLLAWLARRFGPGSVAPIALRMEADAVSDYDDQPEAVAAGLPHDERSHARVFGEIARAGVGSAVPIARLEGRHRGTSGNAIRAAVLGANDGLVSNLSLVMGVAGAGPAGDVVLLSGVAGLLAGALSMALGEWISVRSSAEYVERQIAIERDELRSFPEEEREELVLVYEARGFTEDEARALADRVFRDPEAALGTLAREELGIGEEEGGNPWTAAVVSFLTFAVGAITPVLPWIFASGGPAIALSLLAAGLGLAFTGAVITLFTGRSVVFSSMRMLVFGLAAAGITFAIGSLLGVAADV